MENNILSTFDNTGYSEHSLKPGQPSMFGVLKRFYHELEEKSGFIPQIMIRSWGEKTKADYLRDYLDTLLPHVDGHKAMADFTKEELEEALDQIRNIKAAKNIGNLKPYEDSTMRGFEYLFRILFSYGNKCMKVCDDILEYSHFASPENDTESGASTKAAPKLRKSLDAYEEIALFHKLFADFDQQDGRMLALCLMFFTGLRNSEAAGINFGDFRSFTACPDAYYMVMRQSTERGTNKLKPGGKTDNAPRKLPIPRLLYHFIKQRRDYIKSLIDQGKIHPFDGQEIKTLDDMPVACRGENLNIRCSTQDVTNIANQCFKEIGLDMKMLVELDVMLYRNRYNLGDVEEKDATAYLLRRNLGTHLHNIQFSQAEVQYYLGHEVEMPYESRANFNNEEKLLRMYEKIEQLPICLSVGPRLLPEFYGPAVETLPHDQGELTITNATQSRILIPKSAISSTTKLTIHAIEPGDDIHVKVHAQ
ncbi:MAG: site-specific integrase, partial [Candidatus Hydrogenedens sp.]|nr:site-specific integrase [Candidatus Hydrogenedens sp.]